MNCVALAYKRLLPIVLLVAAACDDDPQGIPIDAAAPLDAGAEVADAGSGEATDGASAGFIPCDVEAVLKAKCQTCHTMPPKLGAPMSLISWADLHKPTPSNPNRQTWEQARDFVRTGVMPPPGSPTGALTAPERATLLGWLEQGAPGTARGCEVTDAGGQ
jgi:uncharacterized membrane protein